MAHHATHTGDPLPHICIREGENPPENAHDAEPFRDITALGLEVSRLRLARWPGPRYAPCREQYRTGPECGMPGAEKGKSSGIDAGDGDSTEG